MARIVGISHHLACTIQKTKNKKTGQIQVVFDSSAQFDGVSLNEVLLTGSDLNNSLLGVFIRFRKDPVAITADIKQMFHCFLV